MHKNEEEKCKSHHSKSKKNCSNLSFIKEYKYYIIVLILIIIIVYFLIHIYFLGNGFFLTTKDLNKKDWLEFLGEYLSFIGTVFISFIAILQTQFFERKDKERIVADRKRDIRPILSVRIVDTNSQIFGTVDGIDSNKSKHIPKHKNVSIEIENVGKFPICNVFVFDKYLFEILKPNDKKTIQVAYSDSPDAQYYKKHIIELLESEYERTDDEIPKYFNINYEDIDGNVMFQTYILKELEGTIYYSLEGTYEV